MRAGLVVSWGGGLFWSTGSSWVTKVASSRGSVGMSGSDDPVAIFFLMALALKRAKI